LTGLPGGAAAVDYVNIGDEESEVGHNLLGWGPVEPASSGGVWGAEPDCRVLWEAGTGDEARSASIDVDFGSTLGVKFLAMRWLDGISYGDHFEFTISGVLGTFTLTDGSTGHPEAWYDLGVWNVGPVTGVHTVTLTATGAPWSGFGTYGQVAFSEMATFMANCWPTPPEEDPAEPPLVDEPAGAIPIDFVDIGKEASEAGHNLQSWGPIVGQSIPGSGNWGGEDDCRVIWDTASDTPSAQIDMDFGSGPGHKYVILRWLDGMANTGGDANDSFEMTIESVPTTFTMTNGTANQPEKWYYLCVWDVGEVVGVRTMTLTATGAKWSMWSSFGQVAFSQIATLADACEGCDILPEEVVPSPELELLPYDAVRIDFVDIGADDANEAAHNLTSWGPVEPLTTGGSWGGEDDCRVIWEAGTDSTSATIDMDFGMGTRDKYLAMRWLDGIANQGDTANDSFELTITGVTGTYSLLNGTASHPETWYDVCVWNVGEVTGIQTVTLTATGTAWSGHGTFGQVAFSTMSTYEGFCDSPAPWATIIAHPQLWALPDDAAMVDYVDIGEVVSEAGHNLQGWGGPEPATTGGNWGGEDDCRVIWEKATPYDADLVGMCATIDMDFGSAYGAKYLAMRWLDGAANDGVVQGAHDSFRVSISGTDCIHTIHDATVGHPETWYDMGCYRAPCELKGIHTVTLCATGMKWAGFNTYGQVAFSEMATFVACNEEAIVEPTRVNATVRLLGVEGPVTRCIKFTPRDDAGCGEPVHVDVFFTGTPATGSATFEVGDRAWLDLNAKDEQHTLGATTGLYWAGSAYYTDLSLDLRGGDTNNDNLVDIDDVTLLIARFGDFADGGTHPWDGTRDADFSDDLVAAAEDYTFVATNWLAFEDFSCDGPRQAGSGIDPAKALERGARVAVPVARLSSGTAARADLNHDNIVDVKDVKLFEDQNGLGHRLSSKIESVSHEKRGRARSPR
jgi:hypothetical protein